MSWQVVHWVLRQTHCKHSAFLLWCGVRLLKSTYCQYLTSPFVLILCSICSADAIFCDVPEQTFVFVECHWKENNYREWCISSSVLPTGEVCSLNFGSARKFWCINSPVNRPTHQNSRGCKGVNEVRWQGYLSNIHLSMLSTSSGWALGSQRVWHHCKRRPINLLDASVVRMFLSRGNRLKFDQCCSSARERSQGKLFVIIDGINHSSWMRHSFIMLLRWGYWYGREGPGVQNLQEIGVVHRRWLLSFPAMI